MRASCRWPTESVPVGESLDRVLAAATVARETLPPWDNSAMDGYAVRSADVQLATPEAPISLRVVGEVAAGHAPDATVGEGTAVRVLTGAHDAARCGRSGSRGGDRRAAWSGRVAGHGRRSVRRPDPVPISDDGAATCRRGICSWTPARD